MHSDDTSDFDPLSDDVWPEDLIDMANSFATKLNIYRVMAHHPDLLRAWSPFRNHLVLSNRLDPQRMEKVILRVGFRLDSVYEWTHHTVRVRACGLTDRQIAQMARSSAEMDDGTATLATAVDKLLDAHRLSNTTTSALLPIVGRRGI